MITRCSWLLFLLLCLAARAAAQTAISGVINTYTAVTAVNSACNSVTVSSAAGYEPGDRVLLIQMKGAQIDLTNGPSFGTVTAYGNAGNYEFATIERIDGQEVRFRNNIVRSYTPAGLVQLIRVPRYTSAVITGVLTSQPWDGVTGGVLVFEVSGLLRFAGNIDVGTRGFRGGEMVDMPTVDCNGTSYFYPSDYIGSANKGEGIAVLREPYFRGRGAAANAGGGGNDHNAGGGGGGNGGAGGMGGRQWQNCDQTLATGGVGGYALPYGAENRIFLGGGGGAGEGNDRLATPGGGGGGIVIIRAGSVDGGGRSIVADGGTIGSTGNDGGGGGGAGGTVLLNVPLFSGTLNISARGGSSGNVDFGHGPGGGGGGGVVWTSSGLPSGSVTVAGGSPGLATGSGSTRGAEPGATGLTLGSLSLPEGTLPGGGPRVDAGRDTAVCIGNSIRLGATGAASYSWDPSTGLSSTTVPDPVATPTSTTTYVVTGRSAAGCYSSDTITVAVLPRPVVTITPDGPLTFCPGDSVVLDAGGGFRGYRWSNGETTRRIAVRTPGRYAVTVTDVAGCTSDSDTLTTTLYQAPAPRITPGDTLRICPEGNIGLDAGAGYAAYRWSSGERTRGITVTEPGNYWVEVTDGNGCIGVSDTVTVELHVVVRPEIVQGDTVSICPGDSAELLVRGTYVSYRWRERASGRDLGTGDRIVVGDAGEYVVTAIDTNGCEGESEPTVVRVNTKLEPVIVTDGRSRICEGDSATLDAGADYALYRWYRRGIGSPGSDTLIVTGARAIVVREPGEYRLEVQSAAGCSGESERVSLEVVPLPVPAIAPLGDTTFCEGDSVALDAGGDYASYLWSTGDTTRLIVVRESGSYSVDVADDLGCTGRSRTVSVEVSPYPEPAIVPLGDTIFCEGDSVILDAGDDYGSYRWSTGDTTRTIIVRQEGSYSVEVASAAGCSSLSLPVSVRVYPTPPVPVVTVRGDTLISSAGENYQWYRDGEPIPGATGMVLIVTEEGFYTVEHRNEIGCGSTSAPVEPDVSETEIGVPLIEGAPGELVVIPLELLRSKNLPEGRGRSFEAELRFNGTLLMPEGSTPKGVMTGDERTIVVTGEREPGMTAGTLANLEFRVLLGNAISTPIRLERFTWGAGGERFKVKLEDGEFRLRDLCITGPVRLVQGDGSFALKPVVPNPASGIVTLEFELAEHGATALYLSDGLGRRVATIVEEELSPGRYVVMLPLDDIPSGIYFCTLQSPTDRQSRQLVVTK